MSTPNAHDFWNFSLNFYRRPGAAPSLIALQDDCGADVNILLLALYAAQCRASFTDASFSSGDNLSQQWRETVVIPVRKMRRALRRRDVTDDFSDLPAIRHAIQATELDAERILQRLLLNDVTLEYCDLAPSELACLNLSLYARRLPRGLIEKHINHLLELFSTYMVDAPDFG